MGHGYIGIIEYGIFRHGETREECLQPVYTKYGAHRVGNNNPSQIAKNNLDINTLTLERYVSLLLPRLLSFLLRTLICHEKSENPTSEL